MSSTSVRKDIPCIRHAACVLFCLLVVWFLSSCASTPPARYAPKAIPERITESVTDDPQENLSLLISFIRDNAGNETEMFRYAHDWVAQNIAYDVKGYQGSRATVTDAYGVIAYGKSVCAGYANVLKLLCDELDIHCKIVSGYARGASFDPFTEAERDEAETNHAWNAVFLEEEWHLVDVTWNAGSIGPEGFRFHYNRNWYKTDPKVFSYTHFPSDPVWQLLDSPLSHAEFVQRPFITGAAEQFQIEKLGDLPRVIRPDSDSHRIVLSAAPETILRVSLWDYDAGTRFRQHRLLQGDGTGAHTVDLCFPAPGRYATGVLAVEDRDSEEFVHIATYFFDVAHSCESRFPTTFGTFSEEQISDLRPLSGRLKKGETIHVSFNAATERRYFVFVPNEGPIPVPHNGETGRYELTFTAPDNDTDSIFLSVQRGRRFHHVARYDLM